MLCCWVISDPTWTPPDRKVIFFCEGDPWSGLHTRIFWRFIWGIQAPPRLPPTTTSTSVATAQWPLPPPFQKPTSPRPTLHATLHNIEHWTLDCRTPDHRITRPTSIDKPSANIQSDSDAPLFRLTSALFKKSSKIYKFFFLPQLAEDQRVRSFLSNIIKK